MIIKQEIRNSQETVLLDLWGVVVDQEKAGGVMVHAYRKQSKREGTPSETVEAIINDYHLVLRNDPSVADRKGDIVDTLQDPAERYLAEHPDEQTRRNLEASVYDDARTVISRVCAEGYNVALFTTRSAEWIRDYVPEELGTIYDAPQGKTPQRFEEIVRQEAREGKQVVSFTEDASKALKAAKQSTEDVGNLIFVDRGDHGMNPAECAKQGITYTTSLDNVYDIMTGKQSKQRSGETKVEDGQHE